MFDSVHMYVLFLYNYRYKYGMNKQRAVKQTAELDDYGHLSGFYIGKNVNKYMSSSEMKYLDAAKHKTITTRHIGVLVRPL